MGGLFDALHAGRTTVEAAQAGIQVTGHNISNANTEGFHRRRLGLSPVAPPPESGGVVRLGGVQVDGSRRVTDELLARQVTLSIGAEAKAEARQTLLVQVEQAGAKIGTEGLSASISALFSKFSALATTPQDNTVREELLATAKSLCQKFNQAATDLDRVADGADKDVKTTVEEINSLTSKIAALNGEIQSSEASGQEASDLRDRQGKLMSDLATLCGATSFTDGAGMMSVLLGSSVIVQGPNVIKLAVTPSAALNGKYRVDLVTGGSTIDITSRITSGKLGGLIDVRDNIIPGIESRIDTLAYDLAVNVNTQHRAGFGLDGVNNRNLFAAPASATNYAASMTLDTNITTSRLAASSTSTGVPGNNVNALALAGLRTSALASSSTVTFNQEATSIAGYAGIKTAEAKSEVLVAKDHLTYMQKMEQSAVGVSLDEEMIQLVQFQRTYQAGVKVLQVVDGLLGKLMEM